MNFEQHKQVMKKLGFKEKPIKLCRCFDGDKEWWEPKDPLYGGFYGTEKQTFRLTHIATPGVSWEWRVEFSTPRPASATLSDDFLAAYLLLDLRYKMRQVRINEWNEEYTKIKQEENRIFWDNFHRWQEERTERSIRKRKVSGLFATIVIAGEILAFTAYTLCQLMGM